MSTIVKVVKSAVFDWTSVTVSVDEDGDVHVITFNEAGSPDSTKAYLKPEEAVRLAEALLKASRKAVSRA